MLNLDQVEKEVEAALEQAILSSDKIKQQDKSPVAKKVSIFGMGYVGLVSSACLYKLGHTVVGVDPNPQTIKNLNSGKCPIIEPGLEEVFEECVNTPKFIATKDVIFAILNTSVSFVCVGTPSAPDGSLDLKYLKQVSAEIGKALIVKSTYHTIAFRSTMEPGTLRNILLPIIEETSGKKSGEDFGVCFHPEFLREGTAIDDFFEPPKTVVGALNDQDGKNIASLYGNIFSQPVIFSSLEVAEMVKYVDNTWHAVKVSFANEIGRICQVCETDGHEVMDIFCQDRKLNLSPYYLKPGFAFGGSCLPKDVRGINKLAAKSGLSTPLLNSIIASNEEQISHAVRKVLSIGNKKVAVLGLTFKKDTDDLRETPTIPMIAALLAQGCEIRVYDPNIKSKKPLQHYLLHAECAEQEVIDFCNSYDQHQVTDMIELMDWAETIVVTHENAEFKALTEQRASKQSIVDLVRLFKGADATKQMKLAGMNSVLQKPVDASQLDKALNLQIEQPSSQTKRILLAEDNIPMNTVIQAKLSRLGYQVDTVTNGADALRMVMEKAYDAILMDIQMPQMDGLEATRRIRELRDTKSKTPIIALSGNIVPENSSTYHGLCW
jgi:GDP-mannose 6-dehydrogenase